MAENHHDTEDRADYSAERKHRRWPDLVTLTVGVATLFLAALLLSDGTAYLLVINARWVLAGGAILVGLVLLIGGSRRGLMRRKRR